MRKTKKMVAITLSLVMCLALFAACTPSTPAPSPSAPAASPSAPAPSPSAPAPSPSAPAPSSPPIVPPAPPPEPPPVGAIFAEQIDFIGDSPIAVLDPANATAGVNGPVRWSYILIYDVLVNSLGEGEFEGSLATSWDSPDNQTFTFKLREGVTFHNGDKFTAQDVIDTIEIARENPGSSAADAWRSVETVRAINDTTVEMVLSTVNVEFLTAIAQPGAAILNKRARDADSERGVRVGTGAYYVSDLSSGNSVTFERNDKYWGEPPITKTIILRYVAEELARTIMLQNGEVQLCNQIGADDRDMFINDPEFLHIPYILSNTNCLIFNLTDPVVGDLNFRKAVAHAIDTEELTMAALGEWAEPERSGTIWCYGMEFRNTNIPPLEFNLDLARDYLEKSVYVSGTEVEYSVSNPQNLRLAEMFQEQMSKIGLSIRINQMDQPSLNAYARWGDNKAQILTLPATGNKSAMFIRNILYPGSSLNRAAYDNPEVAALLDEALLTGDVDTRREIYFKVQELTAEIIPYINVYYSILSIISVKGIGGIVVSNDNNHDLRYMYWDLNA